ncbi:hypothetical protein [Phreatobacter cathodiphilus]|uniref:hypothetical protein n=1 Tax=Phreatobacter cathodiphilus TaxID=1868589 RepID=UPI0011B2253F|nr:hypothetical protein [Phreatobacter cathodiphilus]
MQNQPTQAGRKYDKGERRFKHVGKGAEPEFFVPEDNPKKIVGKCPRSISNEERDRLLQIAIPIDNGDREVPAAKKLYAVRQGAIYEAQTSDFGISYHAYPFRGKLRESVLDKLRNMAEREGCLSQFDDWVRMHIVRHGR